jgi:hypothetical protein
MAYARHVQPLPQSAGFSVAMVLRICADARGRTLSAGLKGDRHRDQGWVSREAA